MSIKALNVAQAALLGLIALSTVGCATKGSYRGAEMEKTYDAELNAKRLAETLNNDDYYELIKENRIYVFSDANDYKVWLKTGEMPLGVTKFGFGPNKETVKMSLTKNETKAMEKIVGYKGGSQNLYEGNIVGIAQGFFGMVKTDDSYYVFDNYTALVAYKKSGAASGYTDGNGPDGTKVIYVGASSEPKELVIRFKGLHDGK